MKEIKIYRHFYDNDKNSDGTDKPNELLGTFEPDEESLGLYSFETEGIRKEDGKKYKIIGQEISALADRYNAGTKCFLELTQPSLSGEKKI